MTRRHSPATAGFSMVEMMIVLVIMGITLAAAVPNVTRYMRHDQVRMGAENFRSACAIAQQRAISTRQAHRVVYIPEDRAYYVERRTSGVWSVVSADTTLLAAEVTMTGGTDGDPSNHVITFEQAGTVAASDVPATISFSNSHHDSSWVRIVRTGRATIHNR